MKLFFNMNKKSLPQVVKQNESDIKELQEKIKPYYTTSVDLNKDSAVVDVSDTNIDESTFVNGYLLTENGKLFNIVSVDDGIAYISFMADFKGAKGDTGLAGGELTSFYFNPNNMGITYNDGKLNIVGQLTFTTASGGQTEQSTIGATIIVPIEGSDDIVVDANEQGNGLSIHLDNNIVTQIQSSVKNSQMLRNLIADSTTIVSTINGQGKLVFYVDASITNKLAKTLVTPMSAPSSIEIVCIDDNNSQVNVDLSDELKIENNQLKTSEIIEKCDILYDKNSNESNKNWGYTGGINANTTITNKDFKKYKRVVGVFGESGDNTWEVAVDLKNPTNYNPDLYVGANSYSRVDTSFNNSMLSRIGILSVSNNKTELKVESGFTYNGSSGFTSTYHLLSLRGYY